MSRLFNHVVVTRKTRADGSHFWAKATGAHGRRSDAWASVAAIKARRPDAVVAVHTTVVARKDPN